MIVKTPFVVSIFEDLFVFYSEEDVNLALTIADEIEDSASNKLDLKTLVVALKLTLTICLIDYNLLGCN